MQSSISGKFQRNEQTLFGEIAPEVPRSFQLKFNSLTHNPLTFVILVWALMFIFAGLFIVYAQEAGKPAPRNHRIIQKAHTSIKSKTAPKQQITPIRKSETVEVFSVGLETLGGDYGKATAGEEKPNE